MKKFKTIEELSNLEERQLISEVLQLQKILTDMEINEAVCSQIHKYHFASNKLLRLGGKVYSGSGFIIGGVYSLSGKQIMEPLTISGGFSDKTINGLLDDIQKSFDYKTEFKPTEKRL